MFYICSRRIITYATFHSQSAERPGIALEGYVCETNLELTADVAIELCQAHRISEVLVFRLHWMTIEISTLDALTVD